MSKKDTVEIEISKHIEDLKGIDDVLYEPRSWSPDALKEACNNVRFESEQALDELDSLTIQYLIRHFFYLQHQTGLYNPQKKLWSLIAQAKKIKIKKFKKLSRKDREKCKVSDIMLEDHNGKFILARFVHPGAEVDLPGFKDLMNNVPTKCQGVFYISDQDLDEKNMDKLRRKTNAEDFFDKYRSPIKENCSFNLVKYQENNGKLRYSLVHPDLAKNVEAELCLVHS